MEKIKLIAGYLGYTIIIIVFTIVLTTEYISNNIVDTIKNKSENVIYHDICNEGEIYTLYTLDIHGNWEVYDFLYEEEAQVLDKYFKK